VVKTAIFAHGAKFISMQERNFKKMFRFDGLRKYNQEREVFVQMNTRSLRYRDSLFYGSELAT